MENNRMTRIRNEYVTRPLNHYDRWGVIAYRGRFDQVMGPDASATMSGGGVLSRVRQIIKGARNFGSKVAKFGSKLNQHMTGELGTAIKNAIPASDDRARKGFTGESHVPLRLSNGKMGIANFAGPGTHVVRRVKRKDPPRTWTDQVAEEHDLNLLLHPNKVRRADNTMIKRLNRLQRDGADDMFNIKAGRTIIKAKKALEDVGLLDQQKFAADIRSQLSPGDLQTLQNRLTTIEKRFAPGQRLRKELVGRGKKQKRACAHKRKRKCVKGRGTKLPGRGVRLPGRRGTMRGKGALLDFINGKVLPKIEQVTGLNKNDLKGAATIVHNAVSSADTPKAAFRDIANKLIPVILDGAKKKFKGSGTVSKTARKKMCSCLYKGMCQEAGMLPMSGAGILDFFEDLGTSIWKAIKPVAMPLYNIAKEVAPIAGAVLPLLL